MSKEMVGCIIYGIWDGLYCINIRWKLHMCVGTKGVKET